MVPTQANYTCLPWAPLGRNRAADSMSPALRTLTKRTGSMRPTTMLRNRVRFCCLLRPQSPSVHLRPRVPCTPFAQAFPMGVRTAPPHCTHAVILLLRPLPLSAASRGSFVRRQVDARGRQFARFWLLCESVKFFFACGGREGVRSQCMVAMLLPAGG